MTRYVLLRLVQAAVLVFIVTVITFFIVHAAPGGPAILYNPMISQQQALQMARTLDLDKPLPQQYLIWLNHLRHGELGISFNKNVPVTTLLRQRLPNTLALSGAALLVAVLIAIPMGILAAVRRGSWLDYIVTTVSMVGLSVPAFWLGIMLIIVFAVVLRWLPGGGMLNVGDGSLIDRLRHLVLPTVVVAMFLLAQLVGYTRASVIQVLHEDFVRTARAKGLSGWTVLYRHALRNALVTVVTVIGLMLPQLVAGTAITETVFTWPGMGSLAVEAAVQRDYPLVMGITLLVAILVVAANLLTDLTYTWLDPRVRLR